MSSNNTASIGVVMSLEYLRWLFFFQMNVVGMKFDVSVQFIGKTGAKHDSALQDMLCVMCQCAKNLVILQCHTYTV